MIRQRYDFYPTPAWCVRRLLEAIELPGGRWLEPAVGDGAIVRAVNEQRSDVSWTTIDVCHDVLADYHVDFVAPLFHVDLENAFEFDVAITNPPYSQASEFVIEARKRARIVAMLLRLNWLASHERHALLSTNMPDVYVLPNRPIFVGHNSDMTEYAWMVWRWTMSDSGHIRVLNTTSINERRAAT